MARRTKIVWLGLVVFCALDLGCNSTEASHRYQIDPLILSKKPIAGRVDEAPPVLIASGEPKPPPMPEMFLAAGPGSGSAPSDYGSQAPSNSKSCRMP